MAPPLMCAPQQVAHSGASLASSKLAIAKTELTLLDREQPSLLGACIAGTVLTLLDREQCIAATLLTTLLDREPSLLGACIVATLLTLLDREPPLLRARFTFQSMLATVWLNATTAGATAGAGSSWAAVPRKAEACRGVGRV